MKNATLISAAKKILKDLLDQCTEGEQLMFKRMYTPKPNPDELTIDEVVENMDPEKMDWGITQCERTIEKKKI